MDKENGVCLAEWDGEKMIGGGTCTRCNKPHKTIVMAMPGIWICDDCIAALDIIIERAIHKQIAEEKASFASGTRSMTRRWQFICRG